MDWWMGPRGVAALLVAIALTATACGGGGEPAAGTGPTEGGSGAAGDQVQGSPVTGSEPPGFESPTPERVVSDEERASADIVLFTGEAPQGFDNGGYGFEEDRVSSPGPTITVSSDEELSLVLENVTIENIDHDFTVVARKDESAEPLWGAQSETIQPGESTLLTFTPGAPGRYFYICSLIGHMSGHGMWGRFVVEGS
jgi:plastocyanin